jgi:hypothetical protein
MQKIQNYLLLHEFAASLQREKGISFRHMAKQLGYGEIMFYKIRTGQRTPAPDKRKLIEKWSKGIVKANKWKGVK